ncbi:hypothetical protein [Haloglomus halophilum]|uniref:hypothetical protein n=1 Tax=Haloglomus halophilum TaxID=2962672 RepID=UPI0020C9EA25|nr:hypothetical protein [Haloglomus halophilum]
MSQEAETGDEHGMSGALDENERGEADDDSGASDQTPAAQDDQPDRATLAAQLDLLQEENRRLRREYARARQQSYRRTALGLALVGVVAAGAGVLFPGARTVLFALGATGIFGALLTYYLTPERFISVSVGEAVYGTLATNGTALRDDLGLGDPIYVPRGASDDVRLFASQADGGGGDPELPAGAALEPGFVITDTTRGLALVPTGDALFDEFERSLTGPLADAPSALAEQLADGLVEQFELVDGADVDASHERVTVGISGSAYGDVGRFDHPVASFLAAGFARGFEVPTAAEVTEADGRADVAVTVRPAREEEAFETDTPPTDQ